MPENYDQILEEDQNVRKFLRRGGQECQKMTWPSYKNVKKLYPEGTKISENFLENFLEPEFGNSMVNFLTFWCPGNKKI